MKFEQHLREFLNGTVDAAEARDLALAAVAGNLRQVKLGIAEHLWLARQLGADDARMSAAHLGAARSLKLRYDAALVTHDRLAGATGGDGGGPGLRVIQGGRSDAPSDTSSDNRGGVA